MKKVLILLASLALAISALVAAPVSVFASSPVCGSYPQLNLYANNNRSGIMGIQCPQFTTEGFDGNFGDSTPAFTGSDNDAMDSWVFYNPTSSTWCLLFHVDANYSGAALGYTLAPTTGYWYRDGVDTFHDRISSVEFWKRTSTTPCA